MHPLLRALAGLAGVVLFSWTLQLSSRLAGAKPFWFDEGFDVVASYGESYGNMLLNGAPAQCSAPPLYHVFEQALVRGQPSPGSEILKTYRWVSWAAAAGTLAVLILGLGAGYGLTWGLVAIPSLIFHPIFMQYSAENRPYAVWLFAFVAFLMALVLRRPALTAVTGTLLSFTAAPGFLQAGGGLITWAVLDERRKPGSWRTHARWMVPVALVFAVIGLFYQAGGKCANLAEGTPYDLLASLRNHQYSVVYHVVQVFWPTMGALSQVLNALLVAGLAFPIFLKKDDNTTEFARGLGWALWAELAIMLVIAVGVAMRNYFFVARLFICLAILRACLISLGAYSLTHWVTSRWRDRAPRSWIEGGVAIVALLLWARADFRASAEIGAKETEYARSVASAPACETWPSGTFQLAFFGGPSPEMLLNSVARWDAQLRACGIKRSAGQNPSGSWVFKEGSSGPNVVETLTPDEKPMLFGGQPIYWEIRR